MPSVKAKAWVFLWLLAGPLLDSLRAKRKRFAICRADWSARPSMAKIAGGLF